MEVDDDVEDDDMDFNPFLREESPSETSSSLTSEAECEETSFENQPSTEVYLHNSLGNENTGDCARPQKRLSSKGACKENAPESTSTQFYCEHGEGHSNVLEKEPLQNEASFAPTVQSSHQQATGSEEEDAICRRTRARYSLANYALEELETFLQESDDEGGLQNVDEEEEYRKFLAAVLSGEGDDSQACQGDETQDEDENDVDFELEIEEALESDGDENAENCKNRNGRNDKDGHRPQTRLKRPELSRSTNCRHESTNSTLRPILPYISPALLAPGHACARQYPSRNVNLPSSLVSVTGAAVMGGFTDQQLGQLHMLIYEHVQLMIQIFSLCVLDPSKQHVAADLKKMIIELVGYRDQALARRNTVRQQFCFEWQHLQSAFSHTSSESLQCQWIPLIKSPIMSILDVSPLHLVLNYLSDVAAAVVKYRKSHLDGTAEKNRSRKEPLFPTPVLSTTKDATNVSQGRSNIVSTASPASRGQLQPKKSLAATLVENTKKESVAPVPFDIARLAQRFYPLFNFSLFPHKPPPAVMVNRVLFTDAEDRLLALGLLEYNNDWGAIQKRFLPCKSTHQIFVRQKNRSSSKAPDNPVKDVRRMKNSPLSVEEVQRIEEGLKIFKNDWTSVWMFLLPHRDPALLQRQWRVATGVQRSYSKSETLKEKRRSYEAKRRKLRASVPDSQEVCGQEADNDASEGVENDDDSYVNEAFLADTDNRSMSMMRQTGNSLDDECGAAHGCFEQDNRNGRKHGVSASYIPFSSCASDGPSSSKRVSGGTLDELQGSLRKEKGGHVVKLAPDLPPVNLPPSVRVISQKEFHQSAAHFNGTSDNTAKDLFPVPPPTFTESVYRQLNLFPDHSTSDRLQQHVVNNRNTVDDGAEQDFPMHPLLFQFPQEVNLSYSHPVQNLISNSRNYDLFPFEKVQVEKSNRQTTDDMEEGAPSNANTIDFHPLLQRTEAEMHEEVPEEDGHQFANQSDCRMRKPPVDDQSTARQASTSPCEGEHRIDLQASISPCGRENNIDLDIHLCSSTDFMSAKDFRSTKSSIQPEGSMKDRASISIIEPGNVCSYHDTEGPSEEAIQGIVMEQEELSDSEEDSQHVEFECEEMDDSEEEQAQGTEPCLTQNKGTSTSVVCSEFQESNDQCQIQQGLVHVVKQGVTSPEKLHGSSSARSAKAKLKPEHAKRTRSRKHQQVSTSRTSEPSLAKTRRPKAQKEEAGAEYKSSDSRRSRKSPAPS
ncbi:uncharacterized protein LOC100833724 [Brachypodium distachyon]|uniref:Myb-like domain-containing protein n=1 Tax=Brachypodium distachyon TaxID=15368 RepID=A0A0Q3HIV2_BRADI|nr:uncharacterized protein LOC100833724 [Brachypodium distachyon]XP_010237671.1 uncharacterized protein LOC100833724 [Brachypodium distachyon]KQJ88273.1 hypothetical protein BRADI_4g16700v3 [Brachypodium distachyon]|eukprot:XP_010237670.1 uncharacterized protein LOC100833724 [Brachypodium distachyon]